MLGKPEWKFTMGEIISITGVKRTRLQRWIEAGWITPAYPSPGKGSPIFFSLGNVYEIAIMRTLIDHNLPRELSYDILKRSGVVSRFLSEQSEIAGYTGTLLTSPIQKDYLIFYGKQKGNVAAIATVGALVDHVSIREIFDSIGLDQFNFEIVYVVNLLKIMREVQGRLRG